MVIQISSKDTLHTIYATAPGMNNEMISSDFELQNYLDILYTEENTEYIKDCSEISFFKCYGTKIAESEEFKCPIKCVSLIHEAIMDTIAHNIPRCETDEENYCMVETKSMKTIRKLKSTCRKQCNYKGSKLVIKKSARAYPYQLGSMQMTFKLYILPEVLHYKEYLIYDDIGMLGSIGGSLGLFLGFSLFDTLCMIVNFILRKVSNQVSQT